MAVQSKQAKKFIGSFCTEVSQHGDEFRVYFEIPSENKKTIDRVMSIGGIERSRVGGTVTGYLPVLSDPSGLFDMKLKKVKVKVPKKKPEPKLQKKVVTKPASHSSSDKPKLTPSVQRKESEAPKKEEEPKKKKGGFFNFGRKRKNR